MLVSAVIPSTLPCAAVPVTASIPAWIRPLSFVVIIAASLLAMIMRRWHHHHNRFLVNEFAGIWLSISNRLLPMPVSPDTALLMKKGSGRPRPWSEQSQYLNTVRYRALEPETVRDFQALDTALDRAARRLIRSKSEYQQLFAPMQLYAEILQAFLVGCEHLDKLRTEGDIQHFNDFLQRQTDIRNGLLRRISLEYSDAFMALNAGYKLDPQADLAWERKELGLPEPRGHRAPAAAAAR